MKNIRKVSYKALRGFRKVPYIRISGNWLLKHGFDVGCQYRLKVINNIILLEPVNKEEN